MSTVAEMNPELGDFLHNAMDQVEHIFDVVSFYHRFAAIKELMVVAKPWLPESYFATRFSYGLRPDYQLFVLRFHPTTVLGAYRLAAIYEESLEPDFPLQQRELRYEHPDLYPQFNMIVELGKFLHDALDGVEHNSTVEAYFHRFESIRKLVLKVKPELPESYFASRFVYGLQEEYQIFVLRFNPVTVAAAYSLALIFEESLYLDYFPEIPLTLDDKSAENDGEKQPEGVPAVDRLSEEVFTSSMDDSRSSLEEEGAVDMLDGGIPVLSIDSMVLVAGQRLDIVSPVAIHEETRLTSYRPVSSQEIMPVNVDAIETYVYALEVVPPAKKISLRVIPCSRGKPSPLMVFPLYKNVRWSIKGNDTVKVFPTGVFELHNMTKRSFNLVEEESSNMSWTEVLSHLLQGWTKQNIPYHMVGYHSAAAPWKLSRKDLVSAQFLIYKFRQLYILIYDMRLVLKKATSNNVRKEEPTTAGEAKRSFDTVIHFACLNDLGGNSIIKRVASNVLLVHC